MDLNKNIISTFALIAGLVLIFTFSSVYGWTPWKKKDANSSSNLVPAGIIGVKKHSSGNATVDLTPLFYDDGKLVFKISINTHNVDDLHKYNLKEITELKLGTLSLKPAKTPRLGGHHNSGKMVFEVNQLSDSFTITITGLDTPGKREFSWP